jgi:uncharacterized membrane protein YgcG
MIKARYFLPALFILALFIVPSGVHAQNPQNFNFESFSGDYYLDRNSEKDSTLKVEETLVAVFPNYDQNHGILRAIPKSYKNHTLSLKEISVTDELGKPYKFTASEENGNKVLKIGDPNFYAHGRTIYIIKYSLQDVTSYYKDHDELFWDINGDQWDQRFGSVTARIHIADPLADSLQDKSLCYAGYFGGLKQNCSITLVKPDSGTYVSVSADNLQPKQTLSAVLAFKPGTFNQKSSAIKKEQRQRFIKFTAAAVLVAVPSLYAFIFMFRRWRQFGNDPKGRGVIIPEYEPPKGFNPLTSDFLLKQMLRNNAISAALIELAVNGYVTIIEIPKKGVFGKTDYKLALNKTPDSSLQAEVHEVLNIIFDSNLIAGTSVQISEFRKNTSKQMTMYTQMKSLENSLASNMTKSGYFIKDPKKVKNGYFVWATLLFFLTFGLAWISGVLGLVVLWGLVLGVGLASAITFFFAFIMPARTEAGVAAHDALIGLKDYIKLAEADRLKFLQSPKGAEKIQDKDAFDPKTSEAKVKLFEKLLPYAMLFGLEKNWAKQFNDIYTNPPGWYQGGNWNAFNAGYLAGSLSDFNSAAAVNFSSPSSSSGSGFSGGGAGGGGGGGGGGGW